MKKINEQITDYYLMKQKKQCLFGFKKKYIGKLKYQMIVDKYYTYLNLKYTKILLEKFIDKQSK